MRGLGLCNWHVATVDHNSVFVSFCQELPPQRNPCAVDLGKSDLELFKAPMITRVFTICMLNQFDLGMVVHVDDVSCGPCT